MNDDDEIVYSTGWLQVSETEPDAIYVWDSEGGSWILPDDMIKRNRERYSRRKIEDPFA